MVFSDPFFLFAFLPAVLLVYWLGAWKIRNAFLAATGLLFYVSGAGDVFLLLVFTILINHLIALAIRKQQISGKSARGVLVTGVALNVASLALWKYAGFAAQVLSDLVRLTGGNSSFTLRLVLPIAISFYTFQCVSYLIDVYQREIDEMPSLTDFTAYIVFFPQLIAGPIVRYTDIESDLLSQPTERFQAFSLGVSRFFWGLGKKILIADQIGVIADRVFELPDNRLSFAVVWIGVIAYALQIYFDFSGYSDMAIGLAHIFGFRFKENFSRPYSSESITDFWRRWHISLSTWFRDYVYIPLGGNRNAKKRRTYFNLIFVFALTGFWHGAQWTFLVWGLFHGFFLLSERLLRDIRIRKSRFTPVIVKRAVVFTVVCFGWALFRSTSIGHAGELFSVMIQPTTWTIPIVVQEVLTTQRLTWMFIGLLVLFVPKNIQFGLIISESQTAWGHLLRLGTVAIVAPLACVYALTTTFSPFLYFQF
jgi:alginate O-acetyltransferase complex protein AlgI